MPDVVFIVTVRSARDMAASVLNHITPKHRQFSLFQKYSVPLFIITLILLAAVFLPPPIGHEAKASTRWINLVYFKFQPSELMKLSMILFMAGFLIRQEKDVRRPWMGFIKTLLIVGCADILLLLEICYTLNYISIVQK